MMAQGDVVGPAGHGGAGQELVTQLACGHFNRDSFGCRERLDIAGFHQAGQAKGFGDAAHQALIGGGRTAAK
jgi:hypothetical protein